MQQSTAVFDYDLAQKALPHLHSQRLVIQSSSPCLNLTNKKNLLLLRCLFQRDTEQLKAMGIT